MALLGAASEREGSEGGRTEKRSRGDGVMEWREGEAGGGGVEQVVDGDLVRGAPELRRERWMDRIWIHGWAHRKW